MNKTFVMFGTITAGALAGAKKGMHCGIVLGRGVGIRATVPFAIVGAAGGLLVGAAGTALHTGLTK